MTSAREASCAKDFALLVLLHSIINFYSFHKYIIMCVAVNAHVLMTSLVYHCGFCKLDKKELQIMLYWPEFQDV